MKAAARDLALDAAFRATRYRVQTAAGAFDLRIGVVNPGFDEVLRQMGVSRWGLITACNPGGVRSDDDNPARQHRLLQRVHDLRWLPACNIADDPAWPAEPGVVLLQVDDLALRALAVEFSQLAIVTGEVGSPPRLVWL